MNRVLLWSLSALLVASPAGITAVPGAAAPAILDADGAPLDDAAADRLAAAGVKTGRTTLDGAAQRIADAALARTLAEFRPAPAGGAIVVLDLRQRALVAVASGPERDRMRAGNALPPGSVIKPLIAVALLESGVADAERPYPCPARISLAGARLRNWQRVDREPMSMRGAIANSCNTVFYQLASRAWSSTRFEGALRGYGLGKPTGLLPREDSGYLPDARSERELLSMAIGQGAILSSPLQIAVAFAAIATGSSVRLLAIDASPAPERGRAAAALPLRVVRDGMRAVATEGTAARALDGLPLQVAAKTGTAEIGFRPTAWFAAYAPSSDPRYVVVAAFEEAGFGADAAGPAVRRVLEGLFDLPSGRGNFIDWRLGALLAAALGVAALRLTRRSRDR